MVRTKKGVDQLEFGDPDATQVSAYELAGLQRQADAVRRWNGPAKCHCGKPATIMAIDSTNTEWICSDCKEANRAKEAEWRDRQTNQKRI